MNLEQTIHHDWAADATLEGLLPAARLFTGCAPPDTPRPLAVLERRSATTTLRTSSGEVTRIELALVLLATDYDAAAAIAAAFAAEFDGTAFDVEEGRVVAMRRREETRRVVGPERVDLTEIYEVEIYRSA